MVTESVQYVAKFCNHVQQVCVGCIPVETCFHNADLTVLKELHSSPPLCDMADKLCLCFDPCFTARSCTECTVVLLPFHAHHWSSVLVQDMQLYVTILWSWTFKSYIQNMPIVPKPIFRSGSHYAEVEMGMRLVVLWVCCGCSVRMVIELCEMNTERIEL